MLRVGWAHGAPLEQDLRQGSEVLSLYPLSLVRDIEAGLKLPISEQGRPMAMQIPYFGDFLLEIQYPLRHIYLLK